MSSGYVRRPGVVTFVGVIVIVEGILGLVAGAAAIAFHDTDSVRNATNQTGDALVATGVAEIVIAVLYLLVGFGLLNGGRFARFLVAFVQVLGMASAVWILVTHNSGGYTTRAFATILIGVFVLWALYGHEKSDEYFLAR